jgi:hypothetical protein
MSNEQQPEDDDYARLFPSRTVKAADIGRAEPTVTIERVVVEQFENDKKKGPDGKPLKEDRWTVYFVGKAKPMVFNKTNCILMEALTGTRNPKKWAGASITLGVRKVQMSGDMVDGLRIIGSPMLTEPKVVTIKLRKKADKDWTLVPTGKAP